MIGSLQNLTRLCKEELYHFTTTRLAVSECLEPERRLLLQNPPRLTRRYKPLRTRWLTAQTCPSLHVSDHPLTTWTGFLSTVDGTVNLDFALGWDFTVEEVRRRVKNSRRLLLITAPCPGEKLIKVEE